MKFVMTGHKGLIGSSLLSELLKEKHEPILLLDKKDGRNILDIENFSLRKSADLMIHIAAYCKINKSIENPYLVFDNNVLGTYKVLEFCRKNKVPKIIFTSSSRIISPEKNPYTASKIYGEELIKGYSQSYGLEWVIVRPSTVYGPFDDQTSRLVDIFILNALKGKELKIFGDKNKTLDFTYINDFVDGFMLAINEKNKEFDISSGIETKVNYVADLIINLAGKGYKSFYPQEIAQPQQVKIDFSNIKKLGFEPKIGVEEGIKRTFEWYKNNFEKIEERRKYL